MRQHKGVDRSENSIDNGGIKPRAVETIGLYDTDPIIAGCEIKAINIGG